MTYPDAKVFVYTYNNLDQPSDIKENSITSMSLITYTVDEFARPKSMTTLGGANTTLEYDSIARLQQISLKPAATDSAYNLDFSFSYNNVNQVTALGISNDLYQYKESGSKTGNYLVNGLNQYTSVGGVGYQYDANGNLTYDGATTFVYDAENRLIGATGSSNASFSYDPSGRLYQITTGGESTYFLYTGDSMIAEYKNSQMIRRNVFGVGVDKPLVTYITNPVVTDPRQFLHSNHQGSIIATTNSKGEINYVNTYDAYGVPGAANQGRFAYTGQMWLPEVGLYYYKARIYYPGIGRFLQTDPIGYKDDMDLYTYVGNDPVNRTDPTGEFSAVELGATIIVGGFIGYKIYDAYKTEQKFEQKAKEKQDANEARDEGYLKKMSGGDISATDLDKLGSDAIKADQEFLGAAGDVAKAASDVASIEMPGKGEEVVTQAISEIVETIADQLSPNKPEAPVQQPVQEERQKEHF